MRAFLCAVFVLGGCGLGLAADEPRDARAVQQAVAVQIFLDRENFGPGKIDGRMGEFTRKALERYRKAKGQPAPASVPVAGNSSQPPAGSTSLTSASAAGSSASSDAAAALPKGKPAASSEAPKESPPRPQSSDSAGDAKSHPAEPAKTEAVEEKVDVSDLDLAAVSPVYVNYTVAQADVEAVGNLPSKPEEMAEVKWLPYQSVAEAVAERFHMDRDFLEELNPGKTGSLRAGDVVRVVNVEPFDLKGVKELEVGMAMNGKEANAQEPSEIESENSQKENGTDVAKKKDAKGETAKSGGKTKSAEEKKSKDGEDKKEAEETSVSIVISKDENMLEVFDAGQMIAAFPVTVGSDQTASPIGEWKVMRIAKLPTFRWDEKMLKEGERSDQFHVLPPGPNNPVGVIWIALNKKGVGVHGTSDPDAIGRNASHGCIRLANWDVVKLTRMVDAGVPVTIR